MNIEQLLHEYREIVDDYAVARAHRTYLEEYKKSLLAILMKKAESSGQHKTVSAQEREAYSNDEYIDWLDNIKEAVEREERLRYKVKQLEMEIEVWRTKQANDRFERKAYGA
jgi:hypothetical protein